MKTFMTMAVLGLAALCTQPARAGPLAYSEAFSESMTWPGWDARDADRRRGGAPRAGFDIDGFVLLGAWTSLTGSGSVYWETGTQLDLSYAVPMSNMQMVFGLWLTGYATDGYSFTDMRPYVSLGSEDFGRVTLGYGENAMDRLTRSVPDWHTFPTLEKDVFDPLIRYDTRLGDTRFSASLSDDLDLSLAVARRYGDWRLFAGGVVDLDSGYSQLKLGGTGRINDRTTLTGTLEVYDFSYANVAIGGKFEVNDRLKLYGSADFDSSGSAGTLIGAKFGIARNTVGFIDFNSQYPSGGPSAHAIYAGIMGKF